MLQSALGDLRKLLLQNGYLQGIITYNVNDVLNRNRNKPRSPVSTVPKKDIIILLPYLGPAEQPNLRVVTRYVGSGIKRVGSRIRMVGSGIAALGSGIGIRTFLGDEGSGCMIFVGPGTKIGHGFGIKDQNLRTEMGSAMKKHTPFPP